MKITKIINTPEGNFEFTTEINSEQHRFIFETGLGYLVSIGALNLQAVSKAAAEGKELDPEVDVSVVPIDTKGDKLH